MTDVFTASTTSLEANWCAWRQERSEYAAAPDGPTALTAIHWIPERQGKPHPLPGIPGKWYRTEDKVIGTGLPHEFTVTGMVRLGAGEQVSNGQVTILSSERRGEFSVSIFHHNTPTRISFHSIATFPFGEQWALPAQLIPEADTVNLTTSDGAILPTPTLGWLSFQHGGLNYQLRVLGSGSKLWTTFSDESSILGVHPFRFLNLDRPDAQGHTVIDLNRAHLPPQAFSKHFPCLMPTQTNHLDFMVEAGEKWAIFN